MIKSASGIGGHAPLPESRGRYAGGYAITHGCEDKNTGIEKRSAPFDTGLSELEGSVMMVFWVSLRPFSILNMNAGPLPSSVFPLHGWRIFILLNVSSYREGRD
jgi:hypothetical protein